MELNENNLEIRKKRAILMQQLAVMQVGASYAKNPSVKKTWEMNLQKTEQQIRDMDDALCSTEIITKFDLLEFD